MKNAVISLLLLIALLVIIIAILLFPGSEPLPNPSPPTQVISPAPYVITSTPLPTSTETPVPTVFTTSAPFFPPQPNMVDDGGTKLREVVAQGGNITQIADVLSEYQWITGEIDLSRANALLLYSDAWSATTYTEDLFYELELTTEHSFRYFGLVTTIYMDSNSPRGYCGIQTNVNAQGDSIDIILSRTGDIKTNVQVDNTPEFDQTRPVYRENIITDGREPYATIYLFHDEPGITLVAYYHVLPSSNSARIDIDYNPLIRRPQEGPLQLRAGTTYGQTTACSYGDFYQYPIHN